MRCDRCTLGRCNEVLTIQEVANILRVHRSTVSRLIKTKKIKSTFIGCRPLIIRSDLCSLFDNQAA